MTHCNLASALLKRGAVTGLDDGQRDAMISHLEAALDADPRLPEAHYALAGVLASRGDLPGAARNYATAAKLKPNFAQAVNNLGVVLVNQGEIEQAIESFQEAVRLRPDYAEAQANLDKAREVKRQNKTRK